MERFTFMWPDFWTALEIQEAHELNDFLARWAYSDDGICPVLLKEKERTDEGE